MTLNYNELLNRYNGSKISVVSNSDHSWKRLRNDMADEIGILNGKWYGTQKISDAYALQSTDIISLTTTYNNVALVAIALPSNKATFVDAIQGNIVSSRFSNELAFDGGAVGGVNDAITSIGRYATGAGNQYVYYYAGKTDYASLAEAQSDLVGTEIYYQLATPISYDESDFAELGITVSGSLESHNDYTQYSVENYDLLPFSEIFYPTNIAQSVANLKDFVTQNRDMITTTPTVLEITDGFASGWSGTVTIEIGLDGTSKIVLNELESATDITTTSTILSVPSFLFPTYNMSIKTFMYNSSNTSIAGNHVEIALLSTGNLIVTPQSSTTTTGAVKILSEQIDYRTR